MIEAHDFIEPARQAGYSFYTGVPCSFLTPFIDFVIASPQLDYMGAASEGEAVAIAAGAWLAGRETVVMCQNSGLGNCVNPLTSLNHPFRIPTLLITTWRGQPGLQDEPQHELMGRVTHAVLSAIEVPTAPFPQVASSVPGTLDVAREWLQREALPYCLVMEKGSVRADGSVLPRNPAIAPGTVHDLARSAPRPTRLDALQEILAAVPEEAAVIATTGKTGRELFTLADREQHLYLVGSMGCAGAVALGVAVNVQRPVIVLDGDGAALMKLGACATIGAAAPKNLVHVVLDNGVHDSTGGQPTVSESVDFAAVAAACGYRRGYSCTDLGGFREALGAALSSPGPALLHIRIKPGSLDQLGRPTVSPQSVARRFRRFLAGSDS